MEPTPYIDEQTGQRFYNVRQAAQIVEGVSEATLWHWAKKGVTSFGFELNVEQEPVVVHRRWGKTKAQHFRETRMLLPEATVFDLREILKEAGRTQPGPMTKGELATLEAATYRRRASQWATLHL